MSRKFLLTIPIVIIGYLVLSWILLDGKVIYTTSEFWIEKADAKKDSYFICDLKPEFKDSNSENILKNNNISFWLSKRDEYKYIGFVFHYLVNSKSYSMIIDGTTSLKFSQENEFENFAIPNSVECYEGDTIKLYFNNLVDSNSEVKIIIPNIIN